jgi:hypothetical protein
MYFIKIFKCVNIFKKRLMLFKNSAKILQAFEQKRTSPLDKTSNI